MAIRTFSRNLFEMVSINKKCRNVEYPSGAIQRFPVPDDKVDWKITYEGYNPPELELGLAGKPWADPHIDDPNFKPQFHSNLDGINRSSHSHSYQLIDGRPQNPVGRTGLRGRGLLGRWGPNHAADFILTRYKTQDGVPIISSTTNKKIAQFCAIMRRDCGQWAVPGGFVDKGEDMRLTARREFLEEALDSETAYESVIDKLVDQSAVIYKGYVDDRRNTDNAWIETYAENYHDSSGATEEIKFKAGDDACDIKWIDISKSLDLYGDHNMLIQKTAQFRDFHW